MINRLKRYILKKQRILWLWWQRKRLKNTDLTIVANNCIGGIIYHDLGLRFQSPTINLDIPADNFLILCEHLEEYLSLPIASIDRSESCPVGVIHGQYGDVRINFRHYKTFAEGVAKWEERKARIHWDNIFIILEDQSCSADIAARFEQLPFAHKVLFSAVQSPHSVCMPLEFYGSLYHWGKILEYPTNSIHRYLERLDYVAFLNDEGIKFRNLIVLE